MTAQIIPTNKDEEDGKRVIYKPSADGRSIKYTLHAPKSPLQTTRSKLHNVTACS